LETAKETDMAFKAARLLAKAPQLHAAYLYRVGRGRSAAQRRIILSLLLFFAWILAASLYLKIERESAVAQLDLLNRYAFLLAGLGAVAASTLVARRRALDRKDASRSWTAALPMATAAAHWQAVAIEFAAVSPLVAFVAAVFAGLGVVAVLFAAAPSPIVASAASMGGVVLGALVGHWMPAPKEAQEYEGSRYVPHRRRALPAIPAGSLSALGLWPVRRMFASARPKAVVRATVPIILFMPLGSTADTAMLVLGLCAVVAAAVLLAVAAVSVSAQVARWLAPLPVAANLLAKSILMRAIGLMLCAAAAQAWLLWMLKTPLSRCIASGASTFLAASLLAIGASARTLAGKERHR
jgi:hypothetical protein